MNDGASDEIQANRMTEQMMEPALRQMIRLSGSHLKPLLDGEEIIGGGGRSRFK